jgi:hypothetical protein
MVKRTRATMADADVLLTMAPMPSRISFLRKLARSVTISLTVIGGGLFIGMLGYHDLGGLSWREAFYFASMILSGEGPPPDPIGLDLGHLSELHLFAGFYALFSGVTFITMVGLLFAPVFHRFLHRFHLELASHDDQTS